MRSSNHLPVDEVEQSTESESTGSTEVGDIVDWEATAQGGPSESSGGRDRSIAFAVAGVLLAALLVGGLVAFVVSRAG